METKEGLTVGKHQYEVRISAESDGEKWYELWLDGKMLGERTRWPIDPVTKLPLTSAELLDNKRRMLIEQQERRIQAGIE
jgi:hypothetical protein